MIRLEKNKLIIEIECKNSSPLSVLAEYQLALIDLIHIADLKTGHHSESEINNGMHFTTNLLKEMNLTEDQANVLNTSLSESKLKEFNNWCK